MTGKNFVSSPPANIRPRVGGKFIFLGDEKLFIRGVSYGGFRPDEHGCEFPKQEIVKADFAHMAAIGLNAIRVYTIPPRSLLDIAQQYGLYIMVGLTAEQFISSLIDDKNKSDCESVVRARVRTCAGHPAVFCYAIANEIPASIVRWLGPRWIERYLERLYWAVKNEDPDGLVTYTNYPTTEYLQLPFLDLVSFNVYLESKQSFKAYLSRLQNLAGDKPLIMSEMGLDSLRNGEDAQATFLNWQIRSSFEAGCGGIFLFSWTDEWHRGGIEVSDWAFGLTDLARQPKPALKVVRDVFKKVPFPPDLSWPPISVIVCTYNGEPYIRKCCEGLKNLEYPNYEVIVVDDGSTDGTANIVNRYSFKLIQTKNRGLSNARNTGLEAARGEIVAFIDDDAYPDPHWLKYLAATFMCKEHVAVGGPNIAPPDISMLGSCIANAPGNPTHVLLSDELAEHIPGCNMAFRKASLKSIGGFDPQFRKAGDDVDICWRLQGQNGSIGFNPAAVVWHRPRETVKAFWRQQVGYGEAEGLLERKWPCKHNALGHWLWSGQIYNSGTVQASSLRRSRIFFGTWGTAAFQSIYQPGSGTLLSWVLMPEWFLLIFILLICSILGIFWRPLFMAVPALVLTVILPIIQAGKKAGKISLPLGSRSRIKRLIAQIIIAFLHILQPLARLWGRMRADLTPWRTRHLKQFIFPRLITSRIWSEHWKAPEKWLEKIEASLKDQNAPFSRGDGYARWDLEVRGGLFGAVRTCMAVEDHKMGTQLIRFRTWPRAAGSGIVLTVMLILLAVFAAVDQAWLISAILGFAAVILIIRIFRDCSAALGSFLNAVEMCVMDLEKSPQ